MDPVSLLTGIPDLIERCIQGYNFFKEVKNAPEACSELMEELNIARARLAELHKHGNRVEDKEKAELSVSLQNYKKTLDKLDSILKVYGDTKYRFTLARRAKWVLSDEKKITTLCNNLKQNSGNLQPLLIQMVRDIGDMNQRQQGIEAKKVTEGLATRLQTVVEWLEPLNSQWKLREVRERRQPETCKWLRSHDLFVSWYESSGSFLWLNGIPGNGKTVLASFIIDHLRERATRDEIVLFAFADFQDVRSTEVVALLRTLLAQLLDHCKPEDILEDWDFAELEKTMNRHHVGAPKSLEYLVELLGKASSTWNRVFIVIDALDECVQENRRESIAAIRKLASAGSKISVFVTSREEQDIVDVLSSVPTISLVNETQGVKDDIGRVIKDKMNNSYHPLARLREPVRARISSTLLKKANGMFRLVDCQLQSLAKAKLEKDINDILRNLPADLNSMYERILQSIEGEGQEAVQIVQRTLWWLVGSQRQLRLAELMEAVMVETGLRDSPNTDLAPLSGEHLLEMCSSLVRYDAETDTVTLSHASVQDFLFSDYLKGTAHHHNYHIPSFSFLHRHTSNLVSAYLHYGDLQNGPCTTEQHLIERLEQHPFLVYIVSNWDLHIVKMYETYPESEKPPDFDMFLTLFDNSEKDLLAQRSRRQVSYFSTNLRDVMEGDSSKLEWTCSTPSNNLERHLSYFGFAGYAYNDTFERQEYDLCEDVSGFVRPHHCAGPPWLLTDEGILQNHPWRDLSNTTSVEELDYMVYPLVSKGPALLVQDLLRKLPWFKERPLFYFGTPLMISIFAGKLDTIKMLLQDLHVNVNTRARHYCCNYEVVSPIFLAIKYGHAEVVEWLLDCGSATTFPPGPRPEWFPEQEPNDGHSCILIGAFDFWHVDFLEIFFCHGVDINTRSRISGDTVLHAAIRYGRIDHVEVLVDAGCDLSPRSKGKTPLDLALNQQSSDLVQYLLDKGASFDRCLPETLEDLRRWAVGELWYPESQQCLVTSGGGPKSQKDIEKIACLLEERLSSPAPHIIRAILDFAELWIVSPAERHKFIRTDGNSPREPYISTPPITGSPENPVRRIIFTTLSTEGGMLTNLEYAGSLYSRSSGTWFEAGVESSPDVFMRIQDNVSVLVDSRSRTHVNVWDYQDAPSSIKEWMAKVKPGDIISVYPRARLGKWVNYVESVKITVYTSGV